MSSHTTTEQADCQSEALEASSSHVPHICDLIRRARNHMAKHGLWETQKKIRSFLFGNYLIWGTRHRPDERPRESVFWRMC